MSIEKLAEHLNRYTLSETLGTGLSDRMAGISPLEYKIFGKDERELASVEEIPQGGKWKLAMHNTYFQNGRALDLNVMDQDNKLIFSIEKPCHNPYIAGRKAVIKDRDNRPMGTIQKISQCQGVFDVSANLGRQMPSARPRREIFYFVGGPADIKRLFLPERAPLIG